MILMRLDDQLTLITQTWQNDSYGIQRKTEQTQTVFCNASSIGSGEFYTAAQTGLQPQYRFIVLAAEYNGQTLLQYKGEDLSVYRTYRRSVDYVELYTEKRQGNGVQGVH